MLSVSDCFTRGKRHTESMVRHGNRNSLRFHVGGVYRGVRCDERGHSCAAEIIEVIEVFPQWKVDGSVFFPANGLWMRRVPRPDEVPYGKA
jgi:hypothetical protein